LDSWPGLQALFHPHRDGETPLPWEFVLSLRFKSLFLHLPTFWCRWRSLLELRFRRIVAVTHCQFPKQGEPQTSRSSHISFREFWRRKIWGCSQMWLCIVI
jgi:hypothetical protein